MRWLEAVLMLRDRRADSLGTRVRAVHQVEEPSGGKRPEDSVVTDPWEPWFLLLMKGQ